MLGSLVATIPRAVVGALMISIAFIVLDRPTFATIRRLVSGKVRNRTLIVAATVARRVNMAQGKWERSILMREKLY